MHKHINSNYNMILKSLIEITSLLAAKCYEKAKIRRKKKI